MARNKPNPSMAYNIYLLFYFVVFLVYFEGQNLRQGKKMVRIAYDCWSSSS